MENLGFGLLLMAVGMLTVFAILLIVIFCSRGIIYVINKVAPPEERSASSAGPALSSSSNVDASVMGVLEAAVSQITNGKGRIIKVTKI